MIPRYSILSQMIPSWISFLICLMVIFIGSKKDLGISMIIGTIIFGLLAAINLWESFVNILDLTLLFLTLSVGLIPILGGMLQESGLMRELIQKMELSNKTAHMISPAIFGLLPIAGGALMSAPLVEELEEKLDPKQKVAINVWFRHVLILIYPLQSSLIIVAHLSGIPLYIASLVLIIPCGLMIGTGYYFLIRNIPESDQTHKRDLKIVLHHLFPIILAPIIDIFGRYIFDISFPEVFLFIGLLMSLWISIRYTKFSKAKIVQIAKDMKFWRYPLLIIAMFFFLDVFTHSGVPELIGGLNLSFIIFLILAFLLGMATGRVQLPCTILIPIYLVQYALISVPLFEFALLYFVVFMGYIITPVHPCVAYSLRYFKTDFNSILKYLGPPVIVCLIMTFGVYGLSTIFSF
jgi:uncharacterized protein